MRIRAESERQLITPFWVWDLLRDKTNYRCHWITKGLGAGGTHGAVLWHLLTCRANKDSKFSWSIGPTFTQVENTLIPEFVKVLFDYFGLVEGQHFDVISSKRPRIVIHVWKTPRGAQEIHFFSAEKAERFVGPSVSHASGTEVGLWRRVAFEKTRARIRCAYAKIKQFLLEGTPEGFNWYEKEANFPEGILEARNYRRIILHTSDNPTLDPDYIDNLRMAYEYDPGKLESYLFGLFVSFNRGTAYWEFFESRNVLKYIPTPQPASEILFCWDFNRSPLAWVAMQKFTTEKNGFRRQQYVCIAESSGKSRGLMDACAEFMARFPKERFFRTEIGIYGGHDGYTDRHNTPQCDFRQIQDYLKAGGFANSHIKADKAAPGIRPSLEKMAALMAYDMLAVSPECTRTINGFAKTSLIDGTWSFEKPAGEDWTHYADGPRYALTQIFKHVNIVNPHAREQYGTSF
jgi:hypothetical protein